MSFKFGPKSSNGNKVALVELKAWRRLDGKSLPETMMRYITEAYMRHSASMRFLDKLCLVHYIGYTLHLS